MNIQRAYRLGVSLVAAGFGVSLLGVIGLVAGIGETTRGAASATATTASSRPTTTTRAAETPEEFLGALAAAFREGDSDFLFARLHPAVIQRYGEEACRTNLEGAADPTASIQINEVQDTGDYEWTTDGQTTTVPNSVGVAVTRVSNGVTVDGVVHIALLDGEFRWFGDCTP